MIQSYTNCFIRTSKLLWQIQIKNTRALCTLPSSSQHNTLSGYSDTDQNYILNILNEKSIDDLSRYSITKVRLKKLEQYRNRKGKFNNLETPLEVDGFGIKVLDKFYKSVLDERDNKKPTEKVVKGKKRNLGFLTPPLDENIRKKVSNIVSIHVSLNAVSWSVINILADSFITVKSCNLYDYKQENKRTGFSQLLQLALSIARLIPEGDIYIFEALQNNVNPTTASTNYVRNDRIQLISMLSAILANRKQMEQNINHNQNIQENTDSLLYNFVEESTNHSVYFMRNMLVARFYKTIIGSESISTEPIILKIFENSTKGLPNSLEPRVIQHVIDFYHTLNPIHKEIFRQAVLIGLTCAKVCVVADEISISKVYSRQ
ncbi:uncharacterized protein LOC113367476 [Ctenocephalides felis]|uniref:uncharacterized protein LOC113367476 n=1 Tax=Ctenocephalides felis TaxID=7515 RepID=UPI000E6E498F|nr:uncharacterized protein LOC113367476 [Ctenocephalides felis]